MIDITLSQIIELLDSPDLETVKLGVSLSLEYPYELNTSFLKLKAQNILDSNSWSIETVMNLILLKSEINAYKSLREREILLSNKN